MLALDFVEYDNTPPQSPEFGFSSDRSDVDLLH